jgi:hypothetical protein
MFLEFLYIFSNIIDKFVAGRVWFGENINEFLGNGEHRFSFSVNFFRVEFENWFIFSPYWFISFKVSNKAPQLLIGLNVTLRIQ